MLAPHQSQLQHNMPLLYAYDYNSSVIDTRISSCSTYTLAHAIEGPIVCQCRSRFGDGQEFIRQACRCIWHAFSRVQKTSTYALGLAFLRIALRTLFDLMNTWHCACSAKQRGAVELASHKSQGHHPVKKSEKRAKHCSSVGQRVTHVGILHPFWHTSAVVLKGNNFLRPS